MTAQGTYLITGGSGFLGSFLVKHLLSIGCKVRSFSRNEHSVEALCKSVGNHPSFSPLLGSVEDRHRLSKAMRGVDFVIHAAAQKIVPLAEYDPATCIQTNVQGTRNVADACLEVGVKRAVFISTDKASAPATLYGASKLCAERLWLGSNRYSAGHGTAYMAVRYGNCWGSTGSVLHAWSASLAKQAPPQAVEPQRAASHASAASGGLGGHSQAKLVLTDPRCTRFHITRPEAAQLAFACLESALPGELWIPKLPTYRIGDLCHAFRLAYGIEAAPDVVGLRLAEKLHEDLISPHESIACREQGEGKYVLVPGAIHDRGGWGYSSGTPGHQLGVEELVGMVKAWRDGV